MSAHTGTAAPIAEQPRTRAGRRSKPDPLISQAAYARLRGVTRQAVNAAVKTNRIHLVGRRIDPKQADRDWLANTDPVKQVRTANGAAPRTPAQAINWKLRNEREEINLETAKLELAERRGRMLDKDEVQLMVKNLARSTRNTILAIAPRLGRTLAGISDPHECERRLLEELERACNAVAESK